MACTVRGHPVTRRRTSEPNRRVEEHREHERPTRGTGGVDPEHGAHTSRRTPAEFDLLAARKEAPMRGEREACSSRKENVMGLRFRRTVRVLPGMHLNLSQRGLSTTLGAAGLSMNLGRHGVRPNVGLPGTGISYRFDPIEAPGSEPPMERRSTYRGVLEIFAAMIGVVSGLLRAVAHFGRWLFLKARCVSSRGTPRNRRFQVPTRRSRFTPPSLRSSSESAG